MVKNNESVKGKLKRAAIIIKEVICGQLHGTTELFKWIIRREMRRSAYEKQKEKNYEKCDLFSGYF